jgi:hypothetical protein
LSPQASARSADATGYLQSRQIEASRSDDRTHRTRIRTSGTRYAEWERLPPPAPTAFPMAVYLERHATMARMLPEVRPTSRSETCSAGAGTCAPAMPSPRPRPSSGVACAQRLNAARSNGRGRSSTLVVSVVTWFDAQVLWSLGAQPLPGRRPVFCIPSATSSPRPLRCYSATASGSGKPIVFVTGTDGDCTSPGDGGQPFHPGIAAVSQGTVSGGRTWRR